MHTPLTQSLPTTHESPAGHRAQVVAPPQSTSVSLPFCTTSEQFGTWQMLPMHTPLTQSAATLHSFPLSHCGQALPPQSVSVSSWFFTLSLHVGA